ncbi:MAG: hypothetical protein WAK55_00840 [Xanthobacteraceae bacterium]
MVKLLLAARCEKWRSLELTRENQCYRNELAAYLQIVANQISNLSANDGNVGGLSWRLELEPAAKPAEDSEAA